MSSDISRPRRVSLTSTNPGESLDVELGQGVNKIGRLPDGNALVLASPAVSRYHAQIVVSTRGIFHRDLGSANGCFHNGARVNSARLLGGDLVGFSEVFTFRLTVEGEAPERAPITETEATATLPWERTGPIFGEEMADLVAPQESGEAERIPPSAFPAPSKMDEPAGLQTLEGDGFQLSAILELTERAGQVQSLEQLEQLLVQVMEALFSAERGFLTYQRRGGDWKLLMLARPHQWERQEVRLLLRRAHEGKVARVRDSRRDPGLGAALTERGDSRVLLPLHHGGAVRGALFLVAPSPHSIDDRTLRLLTHYSATAASALERLLGGEG